ncbi:MAG: enoyl-CoA hydratase-related protein [Coriobacteriia bacterium]|nr:enoyl-CoA hydratase-related protein [Coriobacteriia bacterium]
MPYEFITTEVRGSTYLITLDREQARNAMNSQMMAEMCDALDVWDRDANLRACVIANKGPVFCAGADLKEISAGTWSLPDDKADWGFAGMTKRYFDKPLIAAVRGKCLGGGLEMVLACDLAVASEESLFGFPEPRVGLTAAGGGALLRLAQHIPMKFAQELLLIAEPIDATCALGWGLVNRVVPDSNVVSEALALAEKIALSAPLAIKYSKRTAYETMGASNTIYPSKAWDILVDYEKITAQSEDAHEGSTAFAQKRAPQWKGR